MSLSINVTASDIATEIANDPDFMIEILSALSREFDNVQDMFDTFNSYPAIEHERAAATVEVLFKAMGIEHETD